MNKKIVYELNEVPIRLFDFYANSFPNSAFAKLKLKSKLYKTITADVGSLSPWVTWPTMHRGVSNVDHEISDLGQNLEYVNNEFPSIFEHLSKMDVKVGVFGSLHSYPLPDNISDYSFYVPDTFAAGSECYPKKLSDFQTFNLSMVRANGRNVSKGIAVKDAGRFIVRSRSLGLTATTIGKLGYQIINEQLNKDRLVRRRTSQAEIAFDLFYDQLKQTSPDISFFFTNHVASSMHRYWPTIFPNDYPEGKFDKKWQEQWKDEIPHSIKVANFQLNKLINFCDEEDMDLIVCSSMGQAAVEDVETVSKQALITNVKKLLRYLNISDDDWEPRLSMAPLIVIKPKSTSVNRKLSQLKNISINGKNINTFLTSTGDIRLSLKLTEVDNLDIQDSGKTINSNAIGVEVINLQDASGAYAYHIPDGILMHYGPKNKVNHSDDEWTKISVLDFAPSIINSFGGISPNYMSGDKNLFLN